jgi:RimJ/RimL family protein N-acetyltransferase
MFNCVDSAPLQIYGPGRVVTSTPPPAVRMIGPRVVAREYRLTDGDAICYAIDESRPSLARWVPDIARRHTTSEVREGLELLARDSLMGRRLVCGLWELASGRFIGEAGLYELDWGRRYAEVGFWLRQSARGRGYASEALDLLTEHARGLGLRKLEAHIAPDNVASRRLVERRGYRVVGRRPARPEWDGDVPFILIYAPPELEFRAI